MLQRSAPRTGPEMSSSEGPRFGLASARRVVIKVGSSLLLDRSRNDLDRSWLTTLVADVAGLAGNGCEVVVVSSGAIALGRHRMGLEPGALRLEDAQAAAAVGQIDLSHAYRDAFEAHGIKVAQILLTPWDTENRRRYLNARSTVETLLRFGVVPVVNENDTVATAEIRFGDNDRLSARIAAMISADWLILLSDVAGLHTADPVANPDAPRLDRVLSITPEIEAMAAAPRAKDARNLGSGGMVTKIDAARIATGAGCHVAVADGRREHPLVGLGEGLACTWFVASQSPVQARKQWIAGSLAPTGTVRVDDGAVRALQNGGSLLPAGVLEVVGGFERGDAVAVVDPAGGEVARGLVAYDFEEAMAIAGRQSSEIEELVGFRGPPALIHRDDLVLVRGNRTEAKESR